MSAPDLHTHRQRQAMASRARGKKHPAASYLRVRRKNTGDHAAARRQSLLSRIWRRICSWIASNWQFLLAAVLIVLLSWQGVFLLRGIRERSAREAQLQDELEAQEQLAREAAESVPAFCELRYLVPNQEDLVRQIPYGSVISLHAPVELAGYTFLGWVGPDGAPELRASFPLYEDLALTAKYALQLETDEHIPYLSADEDGVVDVDADVAVREFVEILYRLLNIDLIGHGTFLDVGEKDSCYKAAATLKELGILEGNYLYPDEKLRLLDLLSCLGRFYPPAEGAFDFPDLTPDSDEYAVLSSAAAYGWIDPDDAQPDAVVTRGMLAHVVNRVLGRDTQAHPPTDMVGMILDVGPENPYYADIAEAVIPHSYEWHDGLEVWTGSTPLPLHAPGLFFAGVRLHCILEDGTQLMGVTVDGRSYNANGELTSGDAELDRALWAILEETIDPEVMEPEEMLRILYDYVCDRFTPCDDTLYEVGAQGWAVKEAKRILEKGEASSYGYSALFYELACMIGYQPTLISGSIYGTQTQFKSEDGVRIKAHAGYTPHAWVEIVFDGISYLFDPAGESRVDPYRQYYHRNDPIRWQRGYRSDVF